MLIWHRDLVLTLQRPNCVRQLIEMIHVVKSFGSLQSVLSFKSSSVVGHCALHQLVIALVYVVIVAKLS